MGVNEYETGSLGYLVPWDRKTEGKQKDKTSENKKGKKASFVQLLPRSAVVLPTVAVPELHSTAAYYDITYLL